MTFADLHSPTAGAGAGAGAAQASAATLCTVSVLSERAADGAPVPSAVPADVPLVATPAPAAATSKHSPPSVCCTLAASASTETRQPID